MTFKCFSGYFCSENKSTNIAINKPVTISPEHNPLVHVYYAVADQVLDTLYAVNCSST